MNSLQIILVIIVDGIFENTVSYLFDQNGPVFLLNITFLYKYFCAFNARISRKKTLLVY
jgi:hypothetical protein